MKITKVAAALLGLLLIALAPASAALLAPGGSILFPADPLLPQYLLDSAGPIVADTGVVSFTAISGGFSGKVRQVVYLSAPGDLACPAGGCLDFYYQFSNDAGSGDAIGAMTTNDFSGFLTDVGSAGGAVLLTGVGTIPFDLVNRSTAPGKTVGFRYDSVTPSVLPGTTAMTVGILTNAHYLTKASTQFIDGDVAQVQLFSPTPVPEPASILFLGTALVGLTALLRKKHTA